MKVAIRDDDTCYFTEPEEIISAYDFIWGTGIVSLSVTPFAVPNHKNGKAPFGIYPFGEYDIKNNRKLCGFLRESYSQKKIDVLLHGYSHEYKCLNGKWKSEMIWKDYELLNRQIREAKLRLEEVINGPVTVFVPPTNAIGKKGIAAIENYGLDLSGIIQINDRNIDVYYLKNFAKRWITRVIYGIPYGGLLIYKDHKELNAYTVDKYERLLKEYKYCKRKGFPFVFYTHYWALNSNERLKTDIKRFYEYIIEDGAEIVSLSSLFG